MFFTIFVVGNLPVSELPYPSSVCTALALSANIPSAMLHVSKPPKQKI